MIPMIAWELRRRRTSIIWWSVGLAATVALMFSTYGSLQSQVTQIKSAFGGSLNGLNSFFGTTDMFSATGYLDAKLYYVTLPVIVIILAITLANGLIGREENNRTLELLLARPISRTKLMLAKALAGGLIVAIVGLVTAAVTVVSAQAAHVHIPTHNLLLATVGSMLFSAAFGAIDFMLLAASLATRRVATVIAIVFSLGSYLITSLEGSVHWLTTPAKLLPYHYFQPDQLLNGHLSTGFVWYTMGMYIVSLVIAIWGFARRDIY